VKPPAVELDDDALTAPNEVALEPLASRKDLSVSLGGWEPPRTDEVAENALRARCG
jgi:hypothetical protein